MPLFETPSLHVVGRAASVHSFTAFGSRRTHLSHSHRKAERREPTAPIETAELTAVAFGHSDHWRVTLR